MDILTQIGLPVTLAVLALLPGLYALVRQWRRDTADTALSVVKMLEGRVDRLESRSTRYEQKIEKMEERERRSDMQINRLEDLLMIAIGYIKALTAQMSAAEIEPERKQPRELTEWLKEYHRQRNGSRSDSL